jgi:hypothetical protein
VSPALTCDGKVRIVPFTRTIAAAPTVVSVRVPLKPEAVMAFEL